MLWISSLKTRVHLGENFQTDRQNFSNTSIRCGHGGETGRRSRQYTVPEVDTQHLHRMQGRKKHAYLDDVRADLLSLSDSTHVATFQLGRENGEGPMTCFPCRRTVNHALTHM